MIETPEFTLFPGHVSLSCALSALSTPAHCGCLIPSLLSRPTASLAVERVHHRGQVVKLRASHEIVTHPLSIGGHPERFAAAFRRLTSADCTFFMSQRTDSARRRVRRTRTRCPYALGALKFLLILHRVTLAAVQTAAQTVTRLTSSGFSLGFGSRRRRFSRPPVQGPCVSAI